jgi:hypothetical protein
MAVRRYGVLDADGVKINTITADPELLKTDWYPGYGAYLVDEGEVEPDPPKPLPPTKPETFSNVLVFVLAEPLQNGDKLDVKTGEVIKKSAEVIDPVAVEAVVDETMKP